jgi:hypothetical protein
MVDGYECSEGTYCLPLRGRNTSTIRNEFFENPVVILLVKTSLFYVTRMFNDVSTRTRHSYKIFLLSHLSRDFPAAEGCLCDQAAVLGTMIKQRLNNIRVHFYSLLL